MTPMQTFVGYASLAGAISCTVLGLLMKGDDRKFCFAIAMYFLGFFNATFFFA